MWNEIDDLDLGHLNSEQLAFKRKSFRSKYQGLNGI